jgi:uncharacterized protein YceH (UPF0502 family)
MLTPVETRVLGCLLEKERTTPQQYPLSESALIAACNQTTARDPIVAYDTAVVRPALIRLREQGLVRTVHRPGDRGPKHASVADGALGLDAAQTALLCVLLLRGPQTPGELRARTERLHAFSGVDEVEAALNVLAERPDPLVRRLERAPGRKEARYAELLTDAESAGGDGEGVEGPTPAVGARARGPIEELRDEVAALRREVEGLRAELEGRSGPAS